MDAPKGRRRSAEEKWQVFLETAARDQPTVEVLRRHGLHATDLTRIREAVRRGELTELSRGRGRPKEDPERRRLREELHVHRDADRPGLVGDGTNPRSARRESSGAARW